MPEKRKARATHQKKNVDRFVEELGKKEARKIKGSQETDQTVWFGVGMFGIVGWSIVIPTLIGVALGFWIDHRWPSQYSWTLMLLMAGVTLGCINAWYWVKKGGISKD